MIFLLPLAALAAPADRGLQVQIHPAGLDFAADQLSQIELSLGPTTFAGSWECYDTLSIGDFNLDLVVDTVELVPNTDTFAIDVSLGTIRGEDMTLTGTSGWFDLCIDFDADLEYIELAEGRLAGELSADLVDGTVAFQFVRPPILSGNLDSDIAWFPDDLAWAFMEDTVLELGASMLAEELPPLLGSFTSDSLLLGSFGSTPLSLIISDVESSPEGLYVSADIDLGGTGDGASPRIDLDPRGDSHLAMGLTEGLVQGILASVWELGLLSSDAPLTSDLLTELVAVVGLEEDVEITLVIEGTPQVTIDGDGLRLDAPGVTLQAHAGDDQVLSLIGDLAGLLEIRIVNGALSLTAHELDLEVRELDADHLLDGDADNLQAFLEGWVMQAATAALADLEIYASQYEGLGYVLRLDETDFQDGGLAVWCTLYDADDPAVDRVAPDTTVEAAVHADLATATFAATDDREGTLLFSWQVDNEGWSSWSEAAEVELTLDPGDHELEVISRDVWYNQDPTPAAVLLTVSAPPPEEIPEEKGCGCASGLAPMAWWVPVVGLAAMVRRRGRDPLAGDAARQGPTRG